MSALEGLYRDHAVILRLLDALTARADALASADLPFDEDARADLAEVVGLVRSFADDAHHGKEEGLLFPAMEAAGLPREFGPTACMRHEHEQGREFVRSMHAALEQLAAGADARAGFVAAARGFERLLRAHITKENEVLFPMAGRMLAPDALASLGRAFVESDARHLGAGGVDAVEARVARLEAPAAAGARP